MLSVGGQVHELQEALGHLCHPSLGSKSLSVSLGCMKPHLLRQRKDPQACLCQKLNAASFGSIPVPKTLWLPSLQPWAGSSLLTPACFGEKTQQRCHCAQDRDCACCCGRRSCHLRPLLLPFQYVISCDKVPSLPAITLTLGGKPYQLTGEQYIFKVCPGSFCQCYTSPPRPNLCLLPSNPNHEIQNSKAAEARLQLAIGRGLKGWGDGVVALLMDAGNFTKVLEEEGTPL